MQKSSNKNYPSMTDTAIMKEICRNLRQMRLNKNMSQEELAIRSGMDRTTVSRLESGRAGNILTIIQVLRALDKLDILSVFNEEPDISPIQLLKIQEKKRKKASPKNKFLQSERTL